MSAGSAVFKDVNVRKGLVVGGTVSHNGSQFMTIHTESAPGTDAPFSFPVDALLVSVTVAGDNGTANPTWSEGATAGVYQVSDGTTNYSGDISLAVLHSTRVDSRRIVLPDAVRIPAGLDLTLVDGTADSNANEGLMFCFEWVPYFANDAISQTGMPITTD